MQRPGSALSKLRIQQQNLHANVTQKSVQKKVYTKEEFIRQRDFEGAITLLEHEKLLMKDMLIIITGIFLKHFRYIET